MTKKEVPFPYIFIFLTDFKQVFQHQPYLFFLLFKNSIAFTTWLKTKWKTCKFSISHSLTWSLEYRIVFQFDDDKWVEEKIKSYMPCLKSFFILVFPSRPDCISTNGQTLWVTSTNFEQKFPIGISCGHWQNGPKESIIFSNESHTHTQNNREEILLYSLFLFYLPLTNEMITTNILFTQ